jgi:hypothetical protein
VMPAPITTALRMSATACNFILMSMVASLARRRTATMTEFLTNLLRGRPWNR